MAWQKEGHWECGDYAGGDKNMAFVIDTSGRGHLIETKSLKPLKISSVYKKGDKVWASTFGKLVPA